MTDVDYYNRLVELTGVRYHGNLAGRKLNITVARDNYGAPSSVIVAWEGSPPRMVVFFTLNDDFSPIFVAGKVKRFKQADSGGAHRRLSRFLTDFVLSRKGEWRR